MCGVCAVCAVERALEPGALSREEHRARSTTRSAGQARQLGGGWAVPPARPRGPHWSPAGRRPPSARKPARSRGAAPEPERESRADPTPGRTRGVRDLNPLAPRDRGAAPLVSRAGACVRPPTALRRDPGSSGRPGEWPRTAPRLLPGPAARFCFCGRGAARRGLYGQRPGPSGRPGRGNLFVGRSGIAARGRPQPRGPGGNRWRGPGRALCVRARRSAAGGRASLGRSLRFPPLLSRAAARRRVGRVTERESPGMCLWGLPGSREERRWPRRCGSREVARGLHRPQAGEGMLPAMRVPPGQALHSSAAPLEVGSWVGVCAEKEELGRPVTSGAGSDRCREPAFGVVDLGVPLCPAPRAPVMWVWGPPWPRFNKGCSSPPGGRGSSGEVVFSNGS